MTVTDVLLERSHGHQWCTNVGLCILCEPKTKTRQEVNAQKLEKAENIEEPGEVERTHDEPMS